MRCRPARCAPNNQTMMPALTERDKRTLRLAAIAVAVEALEMSKWPEPSTQMESPLPVEEPAPLLDKTANTRLPEGKFWTFSKNDV